MEVHCLLCNAPMDMRAIGAVITIGDVAEPESAVLCRRCAALPPVEQQRRRNVAMLGMLAEGGK